MSGTAPAGRAVDPYEELYGGEAAQRFFEAGELVGQVGKCLDFGSLINLSETCSLMHATFYPTIEYLKGRTVGVSADCPRIERLMLSEKMEAQFFSWVRSLRLQERMSFLRFCSIPIVSNLLLRRVRHQRIPLGLRSPLYGVVFHAKGMYFPLSLRFARAFPELELFGAYRGLGDWLQSVYGAPRACREKEQGEGEQKLQQINCIDSQNLDRAFHPGVEIDKEMASAILAKVSPEKGLELLAQPNFFRVFKVAEREIIQATFQRECGLPIAGVDFFFKAKAPTRWGGLVNGAKVLVVACAAAGLLGIAWNNGYVPRTLSEWDWSLR